MITSKLLAESLSPHFSRHEFKCKCCRACPIDSKLINALEALRGALGVPIHINSGYRCQAHNLEVGGKRDSRHLVGQAADIVVAGLTINELADECENIPEFSAGGIGRYNIRGFVHVDVGPKKRRWDE